MAEEKIPKKLYRGVVLSSQSIEQGAKWHGVVLKPPREAKIDKNGRKTVDDGNEYGVYMSDNESMVDDVYSKPRFPWNPIKPLSNNIIYKDGGGRQYCVSTPNVGIMYEIDTQGIEVKNPWISQQLSGHYNNGYEGKEWIAEQIPVSNYKITAIKVGMDNLHDAENIDATNLQEAEKQLHAILSKRQQHLNDFCKEIEKMPPIERNNVSSDEMAVYKQIFGDGGVKYTDYSSKDLNTAKDYYMYLAWKIYNKDSSKIDMKTLGYLYQISSVVLVNPKSTLEDLLKQFEKESTSLDKKIMSYQEKGLQNVADKIQQKKEFVSNLSREIDDYQFLNTTVIHS